jgi:hypothetical protein
MTIQPDIDLFPNNVIELMVPRVQTIDADLRVFKRMVRDGDPTQSVGVFPLTWQPDELTYEMDGGITTLGQKRAAAMPTVGTYTIGIQSFVMDSDEEQGIGVHNVLAKMLRTLFYYDTPLGVGLRALSVSMYGSTERFQRMKVGVQRYLTNEIDGVFHYVSSLECTVETETR